MTKYSELFRQTAPYRAALWLAGAATVVGVLLQALVPSANVSLVYVTAIVIAAVRHGMPAALWGVFVCFLLFNFFFTTPRGSFIMADPDDVIDVVWFVVVAVIVGRLAANLQRKMQIIRQREKFAAIELALLQKLVQAVDLGDIVSALRVSMEHLDGTRCYALSVTDTSPPVDWSRADFATDPALEKRVEQLLSSDEKSARLPSIKFSDWLIVPLSDGAKVRSLIFVDLANLPDGGAVVDAVKLLTQQSGMALERTRLLADVAKEKLQKDRELLRSSLLSSISHDFRTPLTAMTGAASTLLTLSGEIPEAQRQELLRAIVDEAKRLDQYTRNLLDMTRLGTGELTLDREWIGLDEIINVVVKRLGDDSKRIVCQIPSDVPELYVHPALVEHAIFNVLHNAVKFSPPGSDTSLSIDDDGECILITVDDQGPGIPEPEREKVFDMFYTAEQGDRRSAGSGLGLAICRGMIGAHGGSVVAESNEGNGCRIVIRLPKEANGGAQEETKGGVR